MNQELNALRKKAIDTLNRFYVICVSRDHRWSDDIPKRSDYRRYFEKIMTEQDAAELKEMIDEFNRNVIATSEALAQDGITVLSLPEPPAEEETETTLDLKAVPTSLEMLNEYPEIKELYRRPEPEVEPKPAVYMPTGFSDKFSNVWEFLSEKLEEAEAQDRQLNRKEKDVETELKAIYAELEKVEYDGIASIDTTRYETLKAKLDPERAEVDALLSELTFAKRVIGTAEQPDKSLCIQLPRVLEMLNEKGQRIFDESDPNLFSQDVPKKEREAEFTELLTEYEEAVSLLKLCSGYGYKKPKPSSKVEIPEHGERLKIETKVARLYLNKLIPVIQAEHAELSESREALANRKEFLTGQRAYYRSDFHSGNPQESLKERDAIQVEISEIDTKIDEAKQLKDEIHYITTKLSRNKMPDQDDCIRLFDALKRIQAEVDTLESEEELNWVQSQFLSEIERIYPILSVISHGIENRLKRKKPKAVNPFQGGGGMRAVAS